MVGTGRNRCVPPPPDSGSWTPWSAPTDVSAGPFVQPFARASRGRRERPGDYEKSLLIRRGRYWGRTSDLRLVERAQSVTIRR
jgi:hypothetical protein